MRERSGASAGERYNAVIVGSGPNGLAAAITLAQAGVSVLVLEAADEIGGGMRSEELTLPGFVHDVCSAVHPLAAASPFFPSLPLARHGLRWIEPALALAHPAEDAAPALLWRDLDATVAGLGPDGDSYRALIEPFVSRWDELARDALAPLHWPAHPLLLGRFGLDALQPAATLARHHFQTERARALFAGIAGHAAVPLGFLGTAAFGLVLAAAAHRVSWPIPEGGSRQLARALAAHLESIGGRIETGVVVRSPGDIPPARAVLLDLTPRQLLRIAGDRLPRGYRRGLERYRYGPGVFKVDWALSDPVPWRSPECRTAGTLHLAGPMAALVADEKATWYGAHSERPLVLVSQPSVFDASRAPAGRHTLWGYCHVPNGSTVDMLPRIEAQIERFAPGFRDCVLARHTMNTEQMQQHDANLIGGDISGGANTLDQIYFRPMPRRVPYATPIDGLYICSASTPPGGGVHGLCGHYAARAALRERFGIGGDGLLRAG